MPKRDDLYWTQITADCFRRNMVCKGCPNYTACTVGDVYSKDKHKKYALKIVKEKVLSIYAHIGKKGLERFYDTRDEQA